MKYLTLLSLLCLIACHQDPKPEKNGWFTVERAKEPKKELTNISVKNEDAPEQYEMEREAYMKKLRLYKDSVEQTVEENYIHQVSDVTSSGFMLIDPDTALLKKMQKDNPNDWWDMTYLKHYYKIVGDTDSVVYESWAPGDSNICSYILHFEPGISIQIDHCNEYGGNTIITLPKMKTDELRAFIEKLFYSEYNYWYKYNTYGPEGAGCTYQIRQHDDKTEIVGYCGC